MSVTYDDGLPADVLKLAQETQDAAAAECIVQKFVYCFGTGNAKTVLDNHIARAILSAISRTREEDAQIAENYEHGLREWGDISSAIDADQTCGGIADAIRAKSLVKEETDAQP